jgi:vacuolar-type H+-ATPase subunit H
LIFKIGGNALEFVINKIMSIDKDAQSYRRAIEELLKQKQDELENEIRNMNTTFQEEAKKIKSSISSEKITEAEHKAMSIRKEKEEQLNSINTKYQSNKLVIVEEVFNRIIKSL